MKQNSAHLIGFVSHFLPQTCWSWDIPPLSSFVWPPPWPGLVSGCPAGPSGTPGHCSWKTSDRKHTFWQPSLALTHTLTCQTDLRLQSMSCWNFVSRKIPVKECPSRVAGSQKENWNPEHTAVFLIPSVSSAALQSSEGRRLKPGFLPVVKKRIIINNVYINMAHLISWDRWKNIWKYRRNFTSFVRFLQKVSTCK